MIVLDTKNYFNSNIVWIKNEILKLAMRLLKFIQVGHLQKAKRFIIIQYNKGEQFETKEATVNIIIQGPTTKSIQTPIHL